MEWTAAIVLGLLGSFHCMGMCGPIALAVPIRTSSTWKRALAAALYNAGRILTYALIGALFGSIGWSLRLAGLQQGMSIALGIVLIAVVLLGWRSGKGIDVLQIPFPFVRTIQNTIGRLMKENQLSGVALIGMLNGFLPCGLVYMAVAGAIATGDAGSGAVWMAIFGAGTFPVMFALIFFRSLFGAGVKRTMRKAVPYVVILMGGLFILRGLNLGIPFISPKISYEINGGADCH